ncbi:hypothetical protein MMC25_005341 [Agyrium rufum]|nr:hypothetical protein [Agyrium rufum]
MARGATRNLWSSGSDAKKDKYYGADDVEAARTKPRQYRFKDAVHAVLEDNRRKQMQTKLQEGVKKFSLEQYRKSPEELKAIKDKKVRTFYENQNDKLDDWLEVDMLVKAVSDDVVDSFDPHDIDGDGIPDPVKGLHETGGSIEPFLTEEDREARRKSRKYARWAINVNVVVNIFLLAAKIGAVFYSSSLSLIASLVDSGLDLLCTLIIWTTNRLVQWNLTGMKKRFPIGRRRLEPIGILVFSVIMIVSFLQILQESGKKLLPSSGPKKAVELPPPAIFAMLSTVIVKGIVWIGCFRIKTTQVQALAQDCKTDVIFNTASLLFPFIGYKADIWWLDPVGAGLLSLFIIFDWASTCLENVARLTGVGVEERLHKKIIYMAYRFSPVVQGYKNITVYHAGDGAWCEIDLLMDEKAPLEEIHDVAETLQYCCEGLPEVDRAFVTVDYSIHGPTGHTDGEAT